MMDLAALTTTEMLELTETISSWIVRRSLTDSSDEATHAIDNFLEMLRQIEQSLCQRQ